MIEAIPTTRPAESKQQQIARIAKEIEQFAASDLSPEQFFPQFLELVVDAVSAPAGAIWMVQNSAFQLCCGVRLDEIGLTAKLAEQLPHARLLAEVSATRQTTTIHTDDVSDLSLPNRHLLVLSAIQTGEDSHAIVEIFQRPDVAPAARSGYLQFIEQMCSRVSQFKRRRKTSTCDANTETLELLTRVGLQLQRSLDVTEVATVATNEGRILVGCDRVSVLIRRGRRVSIQAVSGQEAINPRASQARAMAALSWDVIRSGLPIKFSGAMAAFSPQVEKHLGDFVQESGARLVYVIPLRESPPLVSANSVDQRPPRIGKVFGCLVLEQFSLSEPTPELTERLDWLAAYVSAALHSARTHQAIFLLPLWRVLGGAHEYLHGRKLIKTLAVAAIATAIICAMVLIQVDFRVGGSGRMMPVTQREIFVSCDSEVMEVLVASGEHVVPGQLLVRLQSNELRAGLLATQSQIQEKQKMLLALLAERDDALQNQLGDRTNRIEGDLAKTRIELRGLSVKLDILEERDRRLRVTSPIAGVIATFEVEQLLRHRPVRRGEILMEVMDVTGPWELELQVPEHRMGHLLGAQAQSCSSLPIDFVLVTSPERTFHAQVGEIGTRSTVSADGHSVIDVRADLFAQEQVTPHIGAEVRARVHCGRCSLGYLLFGDVIEFIQKNMWF